MCKNTKIVNAKKKGYPQTRAVGENTFSLDWVGKNTKIRRMVGDNTKNNSAPTGETGKDRSPLLPVRHQPDFFVCDVFDAGLKGDRASMEHPIFSLSKKPDMKARRYENGDTWAEVEPSPKGLATVFDRDVLIYCISQLVAALNDSRPISKSLRLRAHDLLIATNRDTSGRGYLQLKETLERLRGTQIKTNIVTGGKEEWEVFGLIEKAKIVRESRDGRMQEVEIVLSDWVFQAVEAQEVLTLDRRYFQLAKPLERRLYELARKHVGQQPSFKIGLEKLRNKCGSQSTLKEFRRLLLSIIADDTQHNHMPGYSFVLDGDMVEMRTKQPLLPSPAVNGYDQLRLKTESYEIARSHAPGWDVHAIEADWRGWIERKGIIPNNADAHFIAFCKRRGKYPGFRVDAKAPRQIGK